MFKWPKTYIELYVWAFDIVSDFDIRISDFAKLGGYLAAQAL
jgi:hypothetical protein